MQKTETAWQGEHDGYARLGVRHVRSVLMLGEDRWLVVDHLFARRPHRFSLHWLVSDFPHVVTPEQNLIHIRSAKSPDFAGSGFAQSRAPQGCFAKTLESTQLQIRMGLLEGEATFSVVRGDPNSTRGWRSRYYGDKEPAISAMLETERTQACFWTFFGFEEDSVELSDRVLDLRVVRRLIKVFLPDLSAPDGLLKAVEGVD